MCFVVVVVFVLLFVFFLFCFFFFCFFADVFETTPRNSLEQTSLSKAQPDLQANCVAWCHRISSILGSKGIPEEARLFARSLGKTGSVVAWPGSNPVFPLRLCHMSEPYSPNIFGELRHMSELCRCGPLCRMSEPNPLVGG